MDIIQSYYTQSNKNNEAEMMFLFNIGIMKTKVILPTKVTLKGLLFSIYANVNVLLKV